MRIVYADAGPPPDLPTFWLWPDALEVWQLWCGVQTQWATGVAGATGLHYGNVLADLGVLVDDPAERRAAYEDIKAMERGTLEEWATARKANASSRGA